MDSRTASTWTGFSSRPGLRLFTRWGGPSAAAASLIAGVTMWIVGAYMLGLQLPYLASLGASIAAYVMVAAVQKEEASTIVRA